ncbi:MAG TPA: hypothetical protein VFC39_16620 [Acidobacteriaceae bacterium]|nr:hypothetical protein [Acidobacteriaceae bacterium]
MPSIEKRIIDLFEEHGLSLPSEPHLRGIADAASEVQRLLYTTALYEPSEEELSLVVMEFALLCAIRQPTVKPTG